MAAGYVVRAYRIREKLRMMEEFWGQREVGQSRNNRGQGLVRQ